MCSVDSLCVPRPVTYMYNTLILAKQCKLGLGVFNFRRSSVCICTIIYHNNVKLKQVINTQSLVVGLPCSVLLVVRLRRLATLWKLLLPRGRSVEYPVNIAPPGHLSWLTIQTCKLTNHIPNANTRLISLATFLPRCSYAATVL